MKILLSVGYFDPQVGGSEEVVKRLAVGLLERGHDVTVATSWNPNRDPSMMRVPVMEFRVSGQAVTGIHGDILGYQEYLLHGDFDVSLFYAAQIWSTDCALALLSHLSGATVVVPCGYSALDDPRYSTYFSILPRFLHHSDALVYMSPRYRDIEHDHKVGLGRLACVIPNGADDGEFRVPPARSRFGGGKTVLCVANHYPLKGHHRVIRAFQAAAGPDDRLLIVGASPARDPRASCWLRCRAEALRDRRISIVTHASRAEIVAHYYEADVFLFGSYVEAAPLVILESMAAGLPFVTTDVGNVKDYPDAGLVVKPSGLGGGLARLLHDNELRLTLGRAGRKRWDKRHRWSTIIDAYECLFERLVSPTAD